MQQLGARLVWKRNNVRASRFLDLLFAEPPADEHEHQPLIIAQSFCGFENCRERTRGAMIPAVHHNALVVSRISPAEWILRVRYQRSGIMRRPRRKNRQLIPNVALAIDTLGHHSIQYNNILSGAENSAIE